MDSHVKMKCSSFPFKVLANITTKPNCLQFKTTRKQCEKMLVTKVT